MPTRTTAAVLRAPNCGFEPAQVLLDDPRSDEVLVRLVAAGICATDLGVQDGHIPYPLPGVLGHEGAGVVEAVGSAVTAVGVGDQVLLTFSSCGRCASCRRGHPAHCVEFGTRNLRSGRRPDGSATMRAGGEPMNARFFAQSSFSRHALAEERNVVPVAADADLTLLAPLGCGIQTGAGAVLTVLRPDPGATLVVFGAGAVGLSAVMAARLTAARRIIAVDVVPARLQLALQVGATDAIDPSLDDVAARIAQLTGGAGADATIDTTGNAQVLGTAFRCLAPGGTAIVIAPPAAPHTVEVDLRHLLDGRRIIGVTEGDSNPQVFLPALVALIDQGRFPLERLVTRYPFERIDDAVEALRDARVLKPVLTFE